jgi:hypothetical protein
MRALNPPEGIMTQLIESHQRADRPRLPPSRNAITVPRPWQAACTTEKDRPVRLCSVGNMAARHAAADGQRSGTTQHAQALRPVHS